MSALPPDVRGYLPKLRLKEKEDFERSTLPFLQMIWPEAYIPKHLGSLDKAGIDIIVWADTPPHPVVIQCKGFLLTETEIGKNQARQAIESIDAFDKSVVKASTYILLHSRGEKSEVFRQEVDSRLQKLVETGRVQNAERWDVLKLLTVAFNSMVAHFSALCRQGRLGLSSESLTDPVNDENLECVPLRVSEIVANQWQLRSKTPPRSLICDPCSEIFDKNGICRTIFVLGGAGFGKTTVTQRFARNHQNVLYVRAPDLSEATSNRKTLWQQCINLDSLLSDVPNSDSDIARVFAISAIERTFRADDSPALLILDGVDESVFFTRRGGIQNLLNSLRNIKIPVILAMRSELYESRMEDFQETFGLRKPDSKARTTRIRVLELLPWNNDEICALAERYSQHLETDDGRHHIAEFMALIRSDQYESYYGDIPKRPLFLRWILETVEIDGIYRVGRAKLFRKWAEIKIARDVADPLARGGPGRLPLSEHVEGVTETIQLSFEAMMAAAAAMTTDTRGVLELQPDCRFQQISEVNPQLGRSLESRAALVLNSLLVPVASTASSDRPRIKFAHRVYQEFFLASFLLENPSFFGNTKLPQSVEKWKLEISEERTSR